MTEKKIVYPYIPNSAPEVKAQMLRAVNASSVEEFYEEVPAALGFQGQMNLPEPFLSEYALRRHVEGLLRKTPARNRCSIFSVRVVTSTTSLPFATRSTSAANF